MRFQFSRCISAVLDVRELKGREVMTGILLRLELADVGQVGDVEVKLEAVSWRMHSRLTSVAFTVTGIVTLCYLLTRWYEFLV